jgi:hypothetical protein
MRAVIGLSLATVLITTSLALAKPALDAKLVAPEAAAKKGSATVQASISGIEMVDPAQAQEKPRDGQGHLHYRVDGGPIIATTTTKLSFHALAPGKHRISVSLVGNDHQPLGPSEDLEVTIPERGAAAHPM